MKIRCLILALLCASAGAQTKPKMVDPVAVPKPNITRLVEYTCPVGYDLYRLKIETVVVNGKVTDVDHWIFMVINTLANPRVLP